MNTSELKKFAQWARRTLLEQVAARVAVVLDEGSAERREFPAAVKSLESQITASSKAQVIDRAAYIWFNRFTALRYMDARGLTTVRAVSPNEGQSRPALLADAMAGQIDETIPPKTRDRALALLSRSAPSREPEAEAYRLLLVAVCNEWHKAMPFMFEAIADWTELLMPVDLLSGESILARLQEIMTEEDSQDVEIIGWLYQFYISEKKDEVFAGLKKNQKIAAENIPAATQLFTPHWIVRYLVENSVGRLWLLNRPGSKLAERMDYYIAPEEPETDFLKIAKPEEIKICDPACGSGHMLTYAFDLLYAIYEEEGYDPSETPELILRHNLTGIEIDDRAGALAAFALAMKAATRLGRRRFLRMEVKPDIIVLQNVSFTQSEMQDVAAVVGRDLFTDELRETMGQFEQAKNFGSLIVPKLRDPAETLRVVAAREFGGDLLLKEVQERVVAVLRMAKALSSKYHVVVANPPYMGAQGMNDALASFAQNSCPEAKADLYSLFMVRGILLTTQNGLVSMITMQSWMFLSAFEQLRLSVLENHSLLGFLQIGYNSFPELNSKVALACAFVIKTNDTKSEGIYINLNDAPQSADKRTVFFARKVANEVYRRTAHGFSRLPGSPLAYWLSENFLNCFASRDRVGDHARAAKGLVTANNEKFLRSWAEVSIGRVGFGLSREEAKCSGKRWFPYAKGGEFRRWYGNFDTVVNWENDGQTIQTDFTDDGKRVRATNFNLDRIFRFGFSWTVVTTSAPTFRVVPQGFLFDAAAGILQPSHAARLSILGSLNSKFTRDALAAINPTLNLHPGYLENVPFSQPDESHCTENKVEQLVATAKSDWDCYETSWDFTALPLLSPDHRTGTLEGTYARLRALWQGMTDEMQRLEQENNRIFINAYGLQEELTPEVPIEEITLTCNPAYRYGVKGTEEEREARLRADTMAEFLSYAVGCMFGRYSLDAPGLILANQGETLADYLARVPDPSFMPDEDNVIPVLDGDWFADDITERFRKFLRVTFGEEHFQENLAYIEASLGKKVQAYFLRDFYTDHLKRYKKRPIYWLFSSPNGSFNALIYMHRYRPDTVSVVLNSYLREFRTKLEAARREQERIEVSGEASASEKTKALKEKDRLNKMLREIDAYERDTLFPLAEQKIEIDLDDGVKANYPKLGQALFPIKGLGEE